MPRIIDEVLGHAEAGEAFDVGLVVLGPVALDVDLEHEVEAPTLVAHHPVLARVVIDIEDGDEIGGEDALVGVVHRELGAEVDAAPSPEKVLAQHLTASCFG